MVSMLVRNAVLFLCAFLYAGFGQNPERVLVTGIGTGGSDFSFSVSELAELPQRTFAVTDHGVPITFQGVLLADMLAKVAIPAGEKFHKTAASYYVVAEGSDGYRAVFAWAELDPSFTDKAVYVVTKRDGMPLPERDGPFQLVVPGEKRNARWVRQLKLMHVEPNPTAYGSEQARWIAENLPELESIKVGMTREQLLKVFMEEGGISTPGRRRYVYRKCGFIKVDVEFAPTGAPSASEQRSFDPITKISRPFLEMSIMD